MVRIKYILVRSILKKIIYKIEKIKNFNMQSKNNILIGRIKAIFSKSSPRKLP